MSDRSSLTVTAFGIADFERKVLERVFALSKTRRNTFVLHADPASADIHMVDAGNAEAVARWKAARPPQGQPPKPTVVVAKTPPQGARYHARRPFTATRLLEVLDQVATDLAANRRVRAEKAAARAKVAAAVAPQATRHAAGAESRHRALVVDDSKAARTQIGKVLNCAEVETDFAETGDRALGLLHERNYDIVFLDVVMPGIGGYEVCKSIKRDRNLKHIPVVMLTGRSSPFDKVKGRLSGCDTYLTKPVTRQAFEGALNKYLLSPAIHE